MRQYVVGALMVFASGLAALVPGGVANAQSGKPVRIIVAVPPGGTGDILGRLLAPLLTASWNAPVVIENRAGASGFIAAEAAAKAAPDGTTVFFSSAGIMAINPHMHAKLPYDPIRDYTPIAMLCVLPNVLLMNPAVIPAKNVQEFIRYAKERPGKLSYGSLGVGSTSFLSAELLNSMAGLDIQNVPYKGSGQIQADLISGQIALYFDGITAALGQIRSGRLAALAVTTKRRTAALPDIPTMDEQGLAGFEVTQWYGIYGPAGLPQPVVQRYTADFNKALSDPGIREKFADQGAEISLMDADQTGAFTRAELEKWRKFLKR